MVSAGPSPEAVGPVPGQESGGRRLSWPVLLLTLAAVTSSSLSALSLFHLLALRAEVEGLRSEVFRRREETLQQMSSSSRTRRSSSAPPHPPDPQPPPHPPDPQPPPHPPDLQPPPHPPDPQPPPHLPDPESLPHTPEPQPPPHPPDCQPPPHTPGPQPPPHPSESQTRLIFIRKRSVGTGPENTVSYSLVSQPCLQMLADSNRETFQKEFALEPHTGIPWQEGLRRGSALEAESDSILVREEGYYFVYSQVYYMDRIFAMGHVVNRKKRNVVGDEAQHVTLFRCIQDMNPVYPYNTCYTGGIVKLEVGDRVELLIPRSTANISLDGDSTFLGAFRLV
ncbi:tumor necrosis factor ligand superfamily member 13B-like [Salvelinus namaycush]|uniref:Tumor necrosis factor ligand superfamily member 13B-like n=1 Tax=Salvelinus namaycush TaxID=8040 RepID=A0A8U1C605_SALNM|nr:tumor necrosis factor ligand superfamily member 13B-like [Salvelinus namaycush]